MRSLTDDIQPHERVTHPQLSKSLGSQVKSLTVAIGLSFAKVEQSTVDVLEGERARVTRRRRCRPEEGEQQGLAVMSHIKATRPRPGPPRPQPKQKRKSVIEVAAERYKAHKADKKAAAEAAETARSAALVIKTQKRADKMTRIVDRREDMAAERQRGANAMKQQLTRAERALELKREALKQRTMTPDQKLNEARQKLKKFRIEQDANLADDPDDLRSDAQRVADANSLLSAGSIAGFLCEQARLEGQGTPSGIDYEGRRAGSGGRRNSMPNARQQAAQAQMGALLHATAGRAGSPSHMRAVMEGGGAGGEGGAGDGDALVTQGSVGSSDDEDVKKAVKAADDDELLPPRGGRRFSMGATLNKSIGRFRNSLVAATDTLADAAAAVRDSVQGPKVWKPEELFAACAAGDAGALAAAVDGLGPTSVETQDGRGRRPLCVTCAHGRAGTTGALVARADGHALCVRLLLQRGANPLLGTPSAAEKGMAGAHQAALHGAVGCLTALLEYARALDEEAGTPGLNAPQVVDCEADGGVTPLMLATANGQLEALHVLLQAGACVHRVDGLKRSALHHAAGASYKATKALLEAGAPHETRNAKGQTPAEVALAANQRRTAELLAGWGGGAAGLSTSAAATMRLRERRTSVAARGALEGVRNTARAKLLQQAAAGRATQAEAAAARPLLVQRPTATHSGSTVAVPSADGIEEHWDEEQQRPYFLDTSSGHSAWLREDLGDAASEATARADALAVATASEGAAASDAVSEEACTDGVSEHYDDQGYMYFYSAVTGATSYVREEVAPRPAASAAEAMVDEQDGGADAEWPAMARRSSWLHGAKEYTKAQAQVQAADAVERPK